MTEIFEDGGMDEYREVAEKETSKKVEELLGIKKLYQERLEARCVEESVWLGSHGGMDAYRHTRKMFRPPLPDYIELAAAIAVTEEDIDGNQETEA